MPFASFYSTYSALLFQSLAFKPRIDFQQFWAKVIANEAARILEKKTHTHTQNSLSANLLKKACGKFWDWSRMISTLVQPEDLLWSMAPRQSQVEEAMACCRRPGRRASSRYLWGASLMFVHIFCYLYSYNIYIYHISCCVDVYIWMIYLKKQGVS